MKKHYQDFEIYIRPDIDGEQYTTCPKCSPGRKKQKVKCLSVNTVKEVWICHHCGWRGGLEKGASYSDPHWQKPEYSKPRLLKQIDLPLPVLSWFKERGISADTLTANKITFDKVYMPQAEEFVNCIGFPFFKGEEHVNTKWRSKEKHFRQEAGAEKILFGLNDITEAQEIIWVEGEMDKLSFYESGLSSVVSVPDGAPSPSSKDYTSKFSFLAGCESWLQGKTHILCVDNDAAGQKLEEELSRRLGRENCKRLKFPDGIKDANDYLLAYGAEALHDFVQEAQPYPVQGIHEAAELFDGVLRIHSNDIDQGVKTGWDSVNCIYRVKLGQMTIVTGIPNHGKSNWLDCALLNIANNDGWRFGIFSPENQPLERHAAGLVEKLAGKPFHDVSSSEIGDYMAWLQSHYYWILPDLDDDWSIDSILDKAKTLIYRHGINGLVIDPYNEIDHKRPHHLSETEYISQLLTKVRRFARVHNIHIFIVAHPAKIKKDEYGKYPAPTGYDISGSAHWVNKADNLITVFRHYSPGKEDMTEIFTRKIRFKENGKVGNAALRYDPETSRYSDYHKGLSSVSA